MGNLNTRDIICALNWSGFTPRVGVQFKPTDDTLLNASFAQVFRSSGYNLRNLNPNVAPGPFDQEKRDAYELGLKQEFGGFARINLAGFYNKIKGTQREFQAPFAPFGNFQIITNAADVSIKGIEGELLLKPVSGLTIAGQFGYTVRSARRYPDRPVVGRHGHDAPSRPYDKPARHRDRCRAIPAHQWRAQSCG